MAYRLSIAAAQGDHVDCEPQRSGLDGGDHEEQRQALQPKPQMVSHLSQIRTFREPTREQKSLKAMKDGQTRICGLSSKDLIVEKRDNNSDLTGHFGILVSF